MRLAVIFAKFGATERDVLQLCSRAEGRGR
jgi:hypothetical protein